MVFRADALHGLTDDDLARYHALEVLAVYDLRGDIEREERPNPFPSVQFELVGRPSGMPWTPPTGTSADAGEQFLHDLYLGLLDHAGERFGQLFDAMASPGGLPCVLHCHAGKDRTGVSAALLLELLGVPRELVLDDYELTGRYRKRAQQEGTFQRLLDAGMAPEAAAGVLATPRWAMADALRHLDERYGGIDAYVRDIAGVSDAVVDHLRATLLTTAD